MSEKPNQPEVEERRYTSTSGPSTMGRSVVYLTCPFCNAEVKACLWSLAGSGKRCTRCSAKFNSIGTATKVVGS